MYAIGTLYLLLHVSILGIYIYYIYFKYLCPLYLFEVPTIYFTYTHVNTRVTPCSRPEVYSTVSTLSYANLMPFYPTFYFLPLNSLTNLSPTSPTVC